MTNIADVVELDKARDQRNTPEAGSVGEVLRKARENVGMSVEQISELINVRAWHLLSIENMEIERLPIAAYTLGFVKTYAESLNLDGDAIADRFAAEAGYEKVALAPVLNGQAGAPSGSDRGLSIVLIILACLLFFFLAWQLLKPPSDQMPDARNVSDEMQGTAIKARIGDEAENPLDMTISSGIAGDAATGSNGADNTSSNEGNTASTNAANESSANNGNPVQNNAANTSSNAQNVSAANDDSDILPAAGEEGEGDATLTPQALFEQQRQAAIDAALAQQAEEEAARLAREEEIAKAVADALEKREEELAEQAKAEEERLAKEKAAAEEKARQEQLARDQEAEIARLAAEREAAERAAATPEVAITVASSISKVEPVLPNNCQRNSDSEETVVVSYDIDPRGRVQNARVTSSTNSCYNRTSLNAIRRWRYAPRLENDLAVTQAGNSTRFKFKID